MAMLYRNYSEHAPIERPLDVVDLATNNLLRQLQQTMHAEIPLTSAMCIQTVAYDQEGLRLGAPVAQNINDKGSAFSGSLNAVITLAGWGLIWLLLYEQRLRGAIMIQDSTIKYLQAVRRDFVALGHMPERREIVQFQSTLRKHGRARLSIQAGICEDGEPRVTFKGRYVAYLK